jgi:hypothetical protein
MTFVTIHNVHLKLEQDVWEQARQAAEADRRSLTNWIAVLIERALQGTSPKQEQHSAPGSGR